MSYIISMSNRKLQTEMTLEDFELIASKPLPTIEDLLSYLNKFHSILYDAFGYSLFRPNINLAIKCPS